MEKQEKRTTLLDGIKLGFGFYIGFKLARTVTKTFIAVNK